MSGFESSRHRSNPRDESEEWSIDPGRPLALRLLALLGALAFVMLGINSLLPVFQAPDPRPMPKPGAAQAKRA